jgi:hypothetical protein
MWSISQASQLMHYSWSISQASMHSMREKQFMTLHDVMAPIRSKNYLDHSTSAFQQVLHLFVSQSWVYIYKALATSRVRYARDLGLRTMRGEARSVVASPSSMASRGTRPPPGVWHGGEAAAIGPWLALNRSRCELAVTKLDGIMGNQAVAGVRVALNSLRWVVFLRSLVLAS